MQAAQKAGSGSSESVLTDEAGGARGAPPRGVSNTSEHGEERSDRTRFISQEFATTSQAPLKRAAFSFANSAKVVGARPSSSPREGSTLAA